MRRLAFTIVAATAFAGLSGCSESTAVAPKSTAVFQPTPPALPSAAFPNPPAFPGVSRPAQVYVEGDSIYAFAYAYHASRLQSRYVLYDDGSFSLQFSSLKFGFFQYPGTYLRSGSGILFLFRDSNVGGSWAADAKFSGTSMQVNYNAIMVGADFNNGLYVQEIPAP